MCAYDCAQLQYTVQHRTVLIIFPLGRFRQNSTQDDHRNLTILDRTDNSTYLMPHSVGQSSPKPKQNGTATTEAQTAEPEHGKRPTPAKLISEELGLTV